MDQHQVQVVWPVRHVMSDSVKHTQLKSIYWMMQVSARLVLCLMKNCFRLLRSIAASIFFECKDPSDCLNNFKLYNFTKYVYKKRLSDRSTTVQLFKIFCLQI